MEQNIVYITMHIILQSVKLVTEFLNLFKHHPIPRPRMHIYTLRMINSNTTMEQQTSCFQTKTCTNI